MVQPEAGGTEARRASVPHLSIETQQLYLGSCAETTEYARGAPLQGKQMISCLCE